jgi:hypothetical protein
MLMYHPNTASNGITRGMELHRLIMYQDPTLIWTMQSIQNIHEGRFSGAILANHGMNLSLSHVQRNLVVCDNAGKTFGNVVKLQQHIYCIVRVPSSGGKSR